MSMELRIWGQIKGKHKNPVERGAWVQKTEMIHWLESRGKRSESPKTRLLEYSLAFVTFILARNLSAVCIFLRGQWSHSNYFLLWYQARKVSSTYGARALFWTILTPQTFVRAVGVLRSLRKHQQSRDHNFLHQNYTQHLFSTPKNKISETDWKKIWKFQKKNEKCKNVFFFEKS